MRKIVLGMFVCVALSGSAFADVIAAWNFNDAISGNTGGVEEFSVDRGSGTMTSSFGPTGIGNIGGSTANLQEGDAAGQALRLSGNANNGGNLTWWVSTAGFDTIDMSFATSRTGTGFNDNQFLYSIDSGESWMDFGSYSPGTGFGLQEFDLSGILGLNDNPDAAFRIIFSGATSASGNNRIDNLVISGTPMSAIPPQDPAPVPEPSTITLMGLGLACVCLPGLRRRVSKPKDGR